MNTNGLNLRKWAHAKGFTLAEMLTVLAIIILLSTIAAVSTGPFLRRNSIRYAARQAQSAILQARAYAIASNASACVIIYSGERLCVVTNAQYEPIDTPVVLPEGITFRVAASHQVNNTTWSTMVGDTQAATTAGYASKCRPITVITFDHDGTVKFVTPNANTAKTGGAIVICVGGGSAGTVKYALGTDDNEIEVTGTSAFESRGVAILDNELISYQTVTYKPVGNKYVLTDVARGLYSARRTHPANTTVYSASGGGVIVIFPMTGGVVQPI